MTDYIVFVTVDEEGLRRIVENQIDPVEEIIYQELSIVEGDGIYIGEVQRIENDGNASGLG